MSKSYVDSVANLPPPTVEQIAEFVEYVATAHSWYKHLPLLPPGPPFTLSPQMRAANGLITVRAADSATDSRALLRRERFHYTWRPTSDYLSRFGYLTYFADAGTYFHVPMKNTFESLAA